MNARPNSIGVSIRGLVVALCAFALASGGSLAYFQTAQPAQSQTDAPKIPPEQLDSLVAPIALYPDPLLAQTLAASTYPLEIVQLQQWLAKNPKLKDKELADAVAKQPWDPSVQAMAGLPDVVKRLAENIQWTTDLGNAFLAQQADVMAAVQRMRKKAMDKGTLKSGEQQKVETKVVQEKQVIVIEQANPQVVYVPSYDPTVVYGAPYYAYPYPPLYYGYGYGYYAGAAFMSFGVGVMMGAMWSGGWGYGCGWGGGDININRNNTFNSRASANRTNVSNRAGGNNWQHNSAHRGGTPYSNRATANKYGGTTRGASPAQRQAGARQEIGRQGGNLSSARSGAGSRAGSGGMGGYSGAGGGGRGGYSGAGGGGDRIGGRSISSGSGGGSAFGGGSGGYSGSRAGASSSRGASSYGSGGGGYGGGRSSGGYSGGGSRGGGGYSGGGGRGGGGGGRGGGGGGRR